MPTGLRGTSTSEEQISLITIDAKLTELLSQVSKINRRLDAIETRQADYEHSLENLHQEINATNTKLEQLTKSRSELTDKSPSYDNLVKRIEANEHANRAKCLELNGIPFTRGENLLEGFSKLVKATKIDSICPTTDIDNMYRIRDTKRVIIKFTQTNKRDSFFQQYRKNITDTSFLGFKEKDRIFVNEVLSRDQSQLFWKARRFKTEHNFRFIWTFNQKIYLRKTPESDAMQINSQDDIDCLATI
jgi:uncharacterized coiled-coil protein SlyX